MNVANLLAVSGGAAGIAAAVVAAAVLAKRRRKSKPAPAEGSGLYTGGAA